jgi:tetratricopeptide (TPR) repeat protein
MISRVVALAFVLVTSVPLALAQAPVETGAAPAAGGQAQTSAAETLRVARGKFEAGLYAEAAELVKSVLSVDKNNIEGNLLAGEILMAMNDYNNARENFKKVIEIEPSNFKANLALGKIWIATRYWRQAIAFLQDAEKVAPPTGRAEVKRLLARALAASGQIQKGIEKAQEAVQADPDDLDALQILIEIRQNSAIQDPQQLEPTLADADKFVQKATQAVERKPWDDETLARLDKAYDAKADALRALHNSFFQRDVQKRAVDRLLPGKGPDAAAILVRLAETKRAQALLKLILAEHDALKLTERALQDDYDAKNVKFLEYLVASYEQLQELTARLAGPGVVNDTAMRDRAVEACRKIMDLDPQNELARQYLDAAGATPTSQPAANP